MIHRPIVLQNISLDFPSKTCFRNLSAQIQCGQRIAIIGRNGSGKSTLLKIIQHLYDPTEGTIHIPSDVAFGFVPQIIQEYNTLSGGERFNKAFTQALATNPNVLCLDEPTNHLDASNKQSLIQALNKFSGTLIVISHDRELVRNCVDTLWYIDEEKVSFFSGSYDEFIREREALFTTRIHHIEYLQKEQKKARAALEFEQKRAAQSKRMNRSENDRALRNRMRETGSRTSGKKLGKIHSTKKELIEALHNARLPEVIKPTFTLNSSQLSKKTLVQVSDGACGYTYPIIKDINFLLGSQERIALTGDNGSGKSTLVKALLGDNAITKSGNWLAPQLSAIGYLDQHYSSLSPELSVLEVIQECAPIAHYKDIRDHLNSFLFRKNEEVTAYVKTLSGGEKARLSLAQIAAINPQLLILDEVTNNLDFETREHVIQVISEYVGALIVISHDTDFLERIKIANRYHIENGTFSRTYE